MKKSRARERLRTPALPERAEASAMISTPRTLRLPLHSPAALARLLHQPRRLVVLHSRAAPRHWHDTPRLARSRPRGNPVPVRQTQQSAPGCSAPMPIAFSASRVRLVRAELIDRRRPVPTPARVVLQSRVNLATPSEQPDPPRQCTSTSAAWVVPTGNTNGCPPAPPRSVPPDTRRQPAPGYRSTRTRT